MKFRQLFEAIRESCSAGCWSKGVQLARGRSVVMEHQGDDEVVFKVSVAGKAVSPTVSLYLEDEDWSCDCRGREDPCEHVAAAVIASLRAEERGESLEASRQAGTRRVGYRLSREGEGLVLTRVVVAPTGEQPIKGSVLRPEVVKGARLATSSYDLAVELALKQRLAPGRVVPVSMKALLEALAHCTDISLDGVPITIDSTPISIWRGRLSDRGDDFFLQVELDPAVQSLFDNGAAFLQGRLHPIAEPPFSREELSALEVGRTISAGRVGHLVAEVLPALEEVLPMVVETRRLPRGEKTPPRVIFELTRAEGGLRVLPSLVYGEPPIARVDGARLHLFRGGTTVPLRDEEEEARLSHRLQKQWGMRAGHGRVIEPEAAMPWAERLRDAAQGGSIELNGEAALQAYRVVGDLQPQVAGREDGLAVTFEVAGAKVDGAAILATWEAGGRLFELPGGGYAKLPLDWLSRYGDKVAELLACRDPRNGSLPNARLFEVAELLESLDAPQPPKLARLRAALSEGFAGIPPAELPEDLTADLRDYQQQGVHWLAFLRELQMGALLADDMGLGKTLQLLAAAQGRCLVVAPTSVLSNWGREIARFRPHASVCLYHGSTRKLVEADFTLTSYAILRLDVEALGAVEWDTLVLDEAQQIKNPESQAARAAFALDARWRVALTGTPVENRLGDLWSLFHFLNRGLLGGRADFEERFTQAIAHGQAQEELHRRVRPFILRRLKAEVAPDLPPRTEMLWRFALDEQEQQSYDAVRAATQQEVVRKLGGGGSVLAALEALLRLRQAACHTALLPGGEGRGSAPSSKLRLLRDKLEELVAEGHKALVFSQWTSLLDLVEPILGQIGVDFCRLDGQTRDRQGVVECFQAEDPSAPPVMLISLRAGGVGLNLTAADHVFILDPWWNPAVEQQAADRAHRIGQTKPVMVHRLVAEGTVEERMLDLQEKKKNLAGMALEGTASASLSRGDLLDLLV
ncbi:MAG: DEAD/DEAH box helicase [Deltaproteobacteria bacterium]|nr:DEAD/DEAH box helicase [Deltaproteobacteria bacterium]